MNKLKYIFYLFLLFINYRSFSQTDKIKASFIHNGKIVKNVSYYLIQNDSIYKQEYKDGKIILKNPLSNNNNLIAVYKKYKILIPNLRISEIMYLKVYYDNRIINNLIRKKFREPYFRFFFRKHYIIDLGLDDVFVVFNYKNKKILSDLEK